MSSERIFKGDGTYLVEIIDMKVQPWAFSHTQGFESIFSMRILNSSNSAFPVGDVGLFYIRTDKHGNPFPAFKANADVLQVALKNKTSIRLETTSVTTYKGQSYTKAKLSHPVVVLISTVPGVTTPVRLPGVIGKMEVSVGFGGAAACPVVNGATCKRCNTFNEYATPSGTYVCYECR